MTAKSDDIIQTRWWWVRHAPVPDSGRIYGQRDLDCDCSDGAVFSAVAATLPADAVWVTSALKRAKQTARAIQAASDGKHAPRETLELAAFNEQSLGDWQGQERAAFKTAHGITALDFWLTKGDARAPGGESYPDLVARVVPVIHDLNARHRGGNIITVTHGGTIRAALGLAMDLTDGPASVAAHAFTIENCSITLLEHLWHPDRAGAWRIAAVNATPWTGAGTGYGRKVQV